MQDKMLTSKATDDLFKILVSVENNASILCSALILETVLESKKHLLERL